ncbi:MAG: hypothetical protein WD512_18295 [Candidatus Paceibacterota bacterium]
MKVWILTFDRAVALNRLITNFGNQGFKVNIFSNHPRVQLLPDNKQFIDSIVINTLNSPESNSWCARSWNTIFMKGFETTDELICIQDDTNIAPTFRDWIYEQSSRFNFIWGPAGDQFFYIKKHVFQQVGWWDERYIGCYCGDAEYVKRVYKDYEHRAWISVEDSHNWGFVHNPCGVPQNIITTYESKTIDPTYDNQHWQLEKTHNCNDNNNPTIKASQRHFHNKWGIDLDNGKPIINSLERKMPELDWYPTFSKKWNIITHS